MDKKGVETAKLDDEHVYIILEYITDWLKCREVG